MKVVKGIAIFSFFSVLFGSCFDPPEFPPAPEIQYEDIVFKDNPDNSKPDSIILYLAFKDGDGDLGLDPTNPLHLEPPFNSANYFQTNGTGGLVPVPVEIGQLTNNGQTTFINVLNIANPSQGDLAYPRTALFNPAYSTLPEWSCTDYDYSSFIIAANDSAVLDDYSVIEDTLSNDGSLYYMVTDSLYMESNPDHYNITVEFWVRLDGASAPPGAEVENGFYKFDWRKEYCSTFDGRFPVLSDNDDSALDGTLKYNMESRGFNILFAGKTLKLRVQIKDRQRHRSNIVDTPEFTLLGIRG